MDERINLILDDMEEQLTNRQMDQLQKVLLRRLSEKDDEGKFRFSRHSVPGLYLLDNSKFNMPIEQPPI